MPNYGVIDLGSNSVRLCVYEVKDDQRSSYSKKDFRTLLNNKVMAGLSAHVEDGIFTPQGLAHAVDVLRGHSKRLRYFECVRTDTFATAFLRNASNHQEIIETIEKQTGFNIVLLSEQEEAHLGFVGASSDQTLESGTLIDIGGGSTELTLIKNSQDIEHASLNIGSLAAYAKFVRTILPTADEAENIAATLKKRLSKADGNRFCHDTAYGIGGSLRAAAKVYAEIFSHNKRPELLSRKDFQKLISQCLRNPGEFAHLALKAAPDRIHTLIPGCIIAEILLAELGIDTLGICKNGIREGYLIERMLLRQPRIREDS